MMILLIEHAFIHLFIYLSFPASPPRIKRCSYELGLAGVLSRHHYLRSGKVVLEKNGDITYLDWMLSAWGWTVSVSLYRW